MLDAEGDPAIVQSKKNAASGYFNYAKSFSYTAAGAVSSMQLGNGRWESTVFNERLQPTQIALGSTQFAPNSTTQFNADLLKLNFAYGTTANNGNVLSQTITTPSETHGTTTYPAFVATQIYSYDSLNRLKSAEETSPTQPGWKQTFLYDRFGNRNFDTGSDANGIKTTTLPLGCATAVCNPQIDPATNKLVGYAFDNAGNTKTDANGRQFVYDGENKQIVVKEANNTPVGEYYYDGDGKRVKKIGYTNGQASETTIFVYDAGGKLVAEYANQIATTTAQVSYLTSDHLGSPRINTNENGAVIARHDYQPFGEEVARTSYGGDAVRKQFTAYERDNESDLDYAGARYYKSAHGRFNSPDPLLNSGRPNAPKTWNRYAYVLNNPLKLVDPTGLYEWDASLGSGETDETKLSQKVRGRRQAFRTFLDKGRANLAKIGATYGTDSGKYKKAEEALNSYGTENDTKGKKGDKVLVGTDASQSTDGLVKEKDKNGIIHATFKESYIDQAAGFVQNSGDNDFDLLIAHEGRHVADTMAGISLGTYSSEFDGLEVMAVLGEVTNPTIPLNWGVKQSQANPSGVIVFWNPSWREADKAVNRTSAIHNYVTLPKDEGGYGLSRPYKVCKQVRQ